MTFCFDNQFLEQFPDLANPQHPLGFGQARAVILNTALRDELKLPYSDEQLTAIAAGQKLDPAMAPLAQKYTGHQFGHYNPYLGDGRGLLLGEWQTPSGRFDLHLKGAGPTPFSRGHDGRAVLRSCIREYLAGEALFALGIPTTRALAVTQGDLTVYREQPEAGAMLLRTAGTHIRFGHFEYCYHRGKADDLRQLIRYVTDTQWPDLKERPVAEFFQRVVDRTARMIALWQVFGFNHGVMNTDNMSIIGETFDYGPYAMLDRYQPDFICNHSDTTGRYRFSEQPSVGLWNLNCLAQALSPVIDSDKLVASLHTYSELLQTHYWEKMTARLGLPDDAASRTMVGRWLDLLARTKQDYTLSFRRLITALSDSQELLPAELRNHADFSLWWRDYQTLWNAQSTSQDQLLEQMRAANPLYILRNYLAQEAISAAENDDLKPLQRLAEVLANPYTEQQHAEDFAAEPPEWGRHLEISCSS